MNNISIHGEITTESFSSFSKKLNYIYELKDKYVHIELMSEGGSATDALAYSSRIRRYEFPLKITAVGLVASAAVIILASGKKGNRRMSKEAWVMVHEDSGDDMEGSVVQLEAQVKHLRRMESQWSALLEEYTGTPAATWEDLHKREVYLSADECLKLGIVDVIV